MDIYLSLKTKKPYSNLRGMRKIKTVNKGDLVELDGEWVELIIEAKNMGLKLEEVMVFFENKMKEGEKGIEKDQDRTYGTFTEKKLAIHLYEMTR